MCWCQPNVRTPNCGSVACVAAANASGKALGGEREDVLAFLRSEAKRFRQGSEGDAPISGLLEILANQIQRGVHQGARHRKGTS